MAASSPPFVADFDSATGFVRALAAALHDRPFRDLGRARTMGALVRGSALLPTSLTTAAFARAGAREGIAPHELTDVSPERFGEWVVAQYPRRPVSAVAIGSSNGALMHLCAALDIPWLPQTFLVPVARDADPHAPAAQLSFADEQGRKLLAGERRLQIHHMHDPNQDALMVAHLAYFRMKQRELSAAYRGFIDDVLAPGGHLIIVDCEQRWPTTQLGDRYVFQPGAVGGLTPEEYLDGGPRVHQFLAEQGAQQRNWSFPPPDSESPEAEWGYESALTDDVCAYADRRGYHVTRLRYPEPESPSPLVADMYAQWYADTGRAPTTLLAETFISVEPTWTLRRHAVPLWLTFPVERSAAVLTSYLAEHPEYDETLVTLFANGVRSAGQVSAERWRDIAGHGHANAALVGVRPNRWPADFASLTKYASTLHRRWPAHQPRPAAMPLEFAFDSIAGHGHRYRVECKQLL